jgi:hypothetical protein
MAEIIADIPNKSLDSPGLLRCFSPKIFLLEKINKLKMHFAFIINPQAPHYWWFKGYL